MNLEEFFKSANGGCADPTCTSPHGEVFMHPGCHPSSPTWVAVDAKTRTIRLECASCRRVVAKVECPFVN